MPASNLQHVMERRAELLANAIEHRVQVMTDFLQPPGQPPVFSQKVSRREWLEFWRLHRTDEVGAQVLSTWTPEQIMALDTALGQPQVQQQAEVI